MGLKYRYESVYKELFTYDITDHELVLSVIDCGHGNPVSIEWIAFKTGLDLSRVVRVCAALRSAGRINIEKYGYSSKFYNRQPLLNNLSLMSDCAREVFSQ